MFLKKLGKRGVAMTEYAILLAFVAAVAGSFTSDNGLASSITAAIGKAENAINMAMGEKQSNYRYNVQVATENDEKYVDSLNRIINGLYDTYSTEEAPLRDVWYHKDGTVYKYSVYNLSDPAHPKYYDVSDGINVNSFLASDSQFSAGGSWQSHIQFDADGNIDSWNKTDWNNTTRIYLTDKKTNFNDIGITYNTEEKKLSETPDYWK